MASDCLMVKASVRDAEEVLELTVVITACVEWHYYTHNWRLKNGYNGKLYIMYILPQLIKLIHYHM